MKTYQQFCESKHVNLQKMFDMINTKAFGNQLDKIKLKWFNSKKTGGVFQMTTKGNGKILISTDAIKISKTFNFKPDKVMSILAHEMIHYWLVVNGVMKTSDGGVHGKEFQDKKREVSKRLGIDITDKDNIADLDLSGVQKKQVGVILFKKGSQWVLSIYSKPVWLRSSEAAKQILGVRVEDGTYSEAYLGSYKSNLHVQLKVFNKMSQNLRGFLIPDTMAIEVKGDILDNGGERII